MNNQIEHKIWDAGNGATVELSNDELQELIVRCPNYREYLEQIRMRNPLKFLGRFLVLK